MSNKVISLSDFISNASFYKQQEELEFAKKNKDIASLISDFGFEIGDIRNDVVLLIKKDESVVKWIQVNTYTDEETFSYNSELHQLESFLNTFRIVDIENNHFVGMARDWKFEKGKEDDYINVWSMTPFPQMVDCIVTGEYPHTEKTFRQLCNDWIKLQLI